jgi:xanthine/CO dehydrogenase XdhC/CoxF family maturation factor
MDDRRCTAKSKQSGIRCKRAAILGGRVCHIHGGNIPHVRQAAEERLRALQHPAIDRIAKLINQEQFPSVSYAASKDVLDRTMGRATEVVDVTHSGSIDVTILDRLLRGRARNADQHD